MNPSAKRHLESNSWEKLHPNQTNTRHGDTKTPFPATEDPLQKIQGITRSHKGPISDSPQASGATAEGPRAEPLSMPTAWNKKAESKGGVSKKVGCWLKGISRSLGETGRLQLPPCLEVEGVTPVADHATSRAKPYNPQKHWGQKLGEKIG